MSKADTGSETKNNAWLMWCIGLAAVTAVGFVATNIYLHRTNLQLQEDLAQRQQFINESIRLSRFNTQLIQALATLAAQSDDQAIRNLLATQGITFTVNLPESDAGTAQENVDG